MSNFLRSFDPLFDGNADVDAQLSSYGFNFRHDLGGQGARLRALDDLDERGARERADRVESYAPHQLHPHIVPDVRTDRTAEAGFYESIRNAPAPFALRTIGLTDGEAGPLDVFDNSRLRDDRR